MSMVLPNKPTLNLREAAPIMGVSASTLYAAAREGNLPFPVLRINTRYVVPAKPFYEALGMTPQAAA
ncbi:helix-turn-helix transcriptional regulator [Corynebacterium phoceense]